MVRVSAQQTQFKWTGKLRTKHWDFSHLFSFFLRHVHSKFQAFHFTYMRRQHHVSVYFGKINLSSFHATAFAQRNSKRQVKIAIDDVASRFVLNACWKQLKLKNYTRRLLILKGHKSADVQCSHHTTPDKHGSRVFRYYCNYFDSIAEKIRSIYTKNEEEKKNQQRKR